MTHSIASSTTSTTPLTVSEYSSNRGGGTIVHDILGREEPDYSLRPAGMRSGTLVLTYASDEDSSDAEVMHAAADKFVWTTDTSDTVGMTYVVPVEGAIQRARGNGGEWILRVDFREVAA